MAEAAAVTIGPNATHGREGTYNRGCRCDECREAMRKARARRRCGELREKTPPGLQEHGLGGYQRHKCRCSYCRAANAASRQRGYARRKARESA